MSPTIELQNTCIEIFNTQTQTSNPNILDRFHFARIQSAWFSFERHFFSFVPRQNRLHLVSQFSQLLSGQIGRRTPSKIDELRLASRDTRLLRKVLQLGDRRIQIIFDLRRILIRVNSEVAEMTAFATKWNVVIHTQGSSIVVRLLKGVVDILLIIRRPKRKWGVIRDEVIPNLSWIRFWLGFGLGCRTHSILKL